MQTELRLVAAIRNEDVPKEEFAYCFQSTPRETKIGKVFLVGSNTSIAEYSSPCVFMGDADPLEVKRMPGLERGAAWYCVLKKNLLFCVARRSGNKLHLPCMLGRRLQARRFL